MRCAGLAAGVLLTALASPASAFDFRTLAALDGMVTAAPGTSEITNGEVGLRLRADLLRIRGRIDIKADFWGRWGFVGNPPVQELRELSLKVRDLGGRADLTLGRFLTPGGFWLIADGAKLDLRYTRWFTQSVYAGLRAFTTDRRNANLTFDDPLALPLAGTSLAFHHRLFELSLTFTWAKESIDLQNTFDPKSGDLRRERHLEDEFFLDVQALVLPTPAVTLAGGGSFGTRYDVQFAAPDAMGAVAANLGVATLGALSVWALAEWRPVPRLRLSYSGDFERIRLVQSRLLAVKADGTPVQAATGDFLDNGVRGVLLLWKALRADLQYRIRYRGNTDLEHHLVAGLHGDQLLGDAGAFASIGLDVIQLGALRADVISPGTTTSTRVLYSGGLSYVKPWLDARVGVLFTDGIGSGLLFSRQQMPAMGGGAGLAPTQLFPYVLESNRVAFVRVFGVWRGWFGGVDVEENLDSVQLRAMVQLGGTR